MASSSRAVLQANCAQIFSVIDQVSNAAAPLVNNENRPPPGFIANGHTNPPRPSRATGTSVRLNGINDLNGLNSPTY